MKKAEVNQASMTAKLKDAWYPELQKQIKFVAQRFKVNHVPRFNLP